MLFKFLQDILYKKQGNLLTNPDNESEFQPYMMQRWLSMYSPTLAVLINNTTNVLYPVFETKEQWYKALLTTVPKLRFKKIKYLKKTKKFDKKEDELERVIDFLAKTKEISKREVRTYINEYDLDITDLKKAMKES